MIDQRVSPNFWLSEFITSDYAVRKGLYNTPGSEQKANIINLLGPGVQRIRDTLGVPVLITSGYRSPAVNQAVGGSRNSQHMQGLAADFRAPSFGTARTVAQYLMERSQEMHYDQLILEGGWVHVSFVGGKPRNQVLTAHFQAGGVSYTPGISP